MTSSDVGSMVASLGRKVGMAWLGCSDQGLPLYVILLALLCAMLAVVGLLRAGQLLQQDQGVTGAHPQNATPAGRLEPAMDSPAGAALSMRPAAATAARRSAALPAWQTPWTRAC